MHPIAVLCVLAICLGGCANRNDYADGIPFLGTATNSNPRIEMTDDAGKTYQVLISTGLGTRCSISRDVAVANHLQVQNVIIDGKPAGHAIGKGVLTLHLSEVRKVAITDPIVIDNVHDDVVVLGNDFLIEHRAVIDYLNSRLVLSFE